MKKSIFALFGNIEAADKAINQLHQDVGIANDEMSYVYRDQDGNKVAGDGDDVTGETTGESVKDGAITGGAIGAALGLAAAVGLAGPLGAVVAAGPIATALGLTGAAGAVATGGVIGAATGGLIGALTSLGVAEPKAREYEERVKSGDVLVSVHTDAESETVKVLNECGASDIEIIEAAV